MIFPERWMVKAPSVRPGITYLSVGVHGTDLRRL
ncbi:MAG: hypothetical protein U1E61_15755 [Bradyrhizobium sp.]